MQKGVIELLSLVRLNLLVKGVELLEPRTKKRLVRLKKLLVMMKKTVVLMSKSATMKEQVPKLMIQ